MTTDVAIVQATKPGRPQENRTRSRSKGPTDAFLDAFNAIDARLRTLTKSSRHVPFTRVLRAAVEKDPTLGPVADQTELFNQLRNLIVHNGRDLAEPVSQTLVAIRAIRKRLDAPPSLGAGFLRETVTCGPRDSLAGVVRKMASEDFSQLPVYDARGLLTGMITSAAIARWLGAHADGARASLGVPIAEVMKHEEYPKAYRVARSTDTVGSALASFKRASDAGEPLYAIVLTEDGKHTSRPLGLITLFDVPVLWHLALGGASGGRRGARPAAHPKEIDVPAL